MKPETVYLSTSKPMTQGNRVYGKGEVIGRPIPTSLGERKLTRVLITERNETISRVNIIRIKSQKGIEVQMYDKRDDLKFRPSSPNSKSVKQHF